MMTDEAHSVTHMCFLKNMSTGDTVPHTSAGRALACITALVGLVFLSIPLAVMDCHFSHIVDADHLVDSFKLKLRRRLNNSLSRGTTSQGNVLLKAGLLKHT